MKVKELIKILKKQDPDLTILVGGYTGLSEIDAQNVEVKVFQSKSVSHHDGPNNPSLKAFCLTTWVN